MNGLCLFLSNFNLNILFLQVKTNEQVKKYVMSKLTSKPKDSFMFINKVFVHTQKQNFTIFSNNYIELT